MTRERFEREQKFNIIFGNEIKLIFKVVQNPLHVMEDASVDSGRYFLIWAHETSRNDALLEEFVVSFVILSGWCQWPAAISGAHVGFVVTAGALEYFYEN